jgi:hypothetical protein
VSKEKCIGKIANRLARPVFLLCEVCGRGCSGNWGRTW